MAEVFKEFNLYVSVEPLGTESGTFLMDTYDIFLDSNYANIFENNLKTIKRVTSSSGMNHFVLFQMIYTLHKVAHNLKETGGISF